MLRVRRLPVPCLGLLATQFPEFSTASFGHNREIPLSSARGRKLLGSSRSGLPDKTGETGQKWTSRTLGVRRPSDGTRIHEPILVGQPARQIRIHEFVDQFLETLDLIRP